MTTPDPGWYPDPDQDGRLRYWDGSAWTDRTGEQRTGGAEPAAAAPPPAAAERLEAPGANPPEPQTAKRKRRWLPVTAAAAVLVIAAVTGFVLFAGGDEADADVVLQPTASAGQDPFSQSIANSAVKDLDRSGIAGDPVDVSQPADTSQPADASQGQEPSSTITSLSGSTPGLYGGTGSEQVCDPELLVQFLEDNPDEAQAFAGALGIEVEEIPDYVATLTPVILREDTRVTNNGFADGAATPFQAVLQAGTAVLVDDLGVPRVRCACGNPLGEPDSANSSGAGDSYSGESWEDFDQGNVVSVSPASEPVGNFVLIDVDTGESYEQPAGSGGSSGGYTEEKLLNETFEACGLPSAKWVDGEYTGDVPAAYFAPPTTFAATNNPADRVAIGDFTGDGVDDGLAFVNCGSSGTVHQIIELHAFDGARGPLGGAEPDVWGSGSPTSAIRIEDGNVIFDVERLGQGDPACCPSETATVTLAYTNGALAGEPSSNSTPDASSDSTSNTRSDSGWPPPNSKPCATGIYADSADSTSCPFAISVAEAYLENGAASSFNAYSPDTETDYLVSCSGSEVITCTAGDNAIIYFRP